MKIYTTFLSLIFIMTLGFDVKGSEIKNGNHLLQVCTKFRDFVENGSNHNYAQGLNSKDFLDIGKCMGFLDGLLNTHAFVTIMANKHEIYVNQRDPSEFSFFCVPEMTSHLDEISILISGLRVRSMKNKAELEKPAIALAIEILAEKFPCDSSIKIENKIQKKS